MVFRVIIDHVATCACISVSPIRFMHFDLHTCCNTFALKVNQSQADFSNLFLFSRHAAVDAARQIFQCLQAPAHFNHRPHDLESKLHPSDLSVFDNLQHAEPYVRSHMQLECHFCWTGWSKAAPLFFPTRPCVFARWIGLHSFNTNVYVHIEATVTLHTGLFRPRGKHREKVELIFAKNTAICHPDNAKCDKDSTYQIEVSETKTNVRARGCDRR